MNTTTETTTVNTALAKNPATLTTHAPEIVARYERIRPRVRRSSRDISGGGTAMFRSEHGVTELSWPCDSRAMALRFESGYGWVKTPATGHWKQTVIALEDIILAESRQA